MTDTMRWQAIAARDPNFNGTFVYCVKTTRIYCRPICKARLARRSNVEFCNTPQQAEDLGYRACKRCRPEELTHVLSPEDERIGRARKALHQLPVDATPPSLDDMAATAGLTKHHFHRRFKHLTGLTPREYVLGMQSARRKSRHSTTTSSPSLTGMSHDRGMDFNSESATAYDNTTTVSASHEQRPIYFSARKTTHGLLLAVSDDQQRVQKLELCADDREATAVLDRAYPKGACIRVSLDPLYGLECHEWHQQVDEAVEALERPSGKTLKLSASVVV